MAPGARARRRRASWTVAAAALTAGVAAAPAAAAQVRVTGVIAGAKGAKVIALAPDGSAVSTTATAGGRFTLRMPAAKARGARLQIVSAEGSYVGPVVLRRKGRSGYVALSGRTAALGRIVVARGFGKVTRPVPANAVDPSAVARLTKDGRPLGAGRLGLAPGGAITMGAPTAVLAAVPGSGGTDGGGGGATFGGGGGGGGGGEEQRGADGDRDGLPNAFDADDDGDGTLDTVDPQSASANRGLFSTLFLPFHQALNANAAGVTPDAIDAVIAGDNVFALNFFFDEGYAGGRTVTGAHVDCGGLVYCARGTGTAMLGGGFMNPDGTPALPGGIRWVDYTPDGSGYPNLGQVRSSDGRPSWAAGVQPKVGTDRLRPGDTYTVVLNTATGPVENPTVLSPYFVTTPALASWSTGGTTTPVTYPVPAGAPGTEASPIPLAGPLTLTFWRPQRRAIPGAETGDLMDMGQLRYGIVLTADNGSREFGCPSHTTSLSPTLAPSTGGSDAMATSLTPLRDSSTDAAPDTTRTLSFAVDVAGCLAANGAPATGTVSATLTAATEARPGGMDRAALTISLRLP
ncbi:MAG: hypothetical protein AB1416_02035 [Actinomycetota bacterium]